MRIPLRLGLAVAVVIPLLAVLLKPVVPAHADTVSTKPNIVMILLDDLDETTSPYWDAMPITKSLIQTHGVTFKNAFAPTPICCPARSTILTGKYGHNTGVLTNGGDRGGWATFVAHGNEDHTFPLWLQQNGYHTGLIGKYLNGIEAQPEHIPPGWSEWYGAVDNFFYSGYDYKLNENGTMVSYGHQESDYSTDVVSRKATDFIRRVKQNGDKPFMLYVAPTAPHLPLPPAPRHADNPYKHANAPERPNYQEKDLSDKPSWLRLTGVQRKAIVELWNNFDYRNRMGSLYAADEMVGAIVDALKETGQLENTWIVFTSDNGYNLGAHRLIHKMAPYEESIRVPLVIIGPGVPDSMQGKSVSQMVLESDFAPTFAELAGVPVPSDVDGNSLVGILSGKPPANWRHDMIMQYVTNGAANGIGQELPPWLFVAIGQEIPTYKAVRTESHLYVEWYDDDKPFHEKELYDLNADPYELNNVLSTAKGKAENKALTDTMAARLLELEACKGENCRY